MLQDLDKFKLLYLGSVLQNNATAAADKEIASRIQKAVSNFHILYQRVNKKHTSQAKAQITGS